MKKYVVVYHAPDELMAKMAEISPEDQKKGMEGWHKWAEGLGKGLVDLGQPLGGGQKVTQNGTFASTGEVAGYSILQAESMDEAVKMLEGHPHLMWANSCDIEVYEAMPLPA